METADPWFRRAPGPAGAARLFHFPFAGGNPTALLSWQEPLGPGVELFVATLPGRGARLFEPPVSDVAELVGHLTAAVARLADRPFGLFGHSLGALLAFEVTRALRRGGHPMPVELWVSGAEGPQTRSVQRHLHDLPADDLLDALRDYAGTPAELLAEREMMDLLLPGIRADFALSETYVYRPDAPLDVPLHLLRGDRDPHVDAGRAAGWARECTGPLTEHVFSGAHFFLDGHRAGIAALLRAGLAERTSS